MSITKYNSTARRFSFVASPDFKYYKLRDMKADKVYPIMGWYINEKGKYGPSAAIITDRFYVNVPQHIMEKLRKMEDDPEVIADVNAGKCGFQVKKYTTNTGSEGYTIEFKEVEPLPF